MLKFKQFLREGLFSFAKIHSDIGIKQLKTLTQSVKHKEMRYVIDTDDKLHAADSHKFTHDDIVPLENQKYRGYINHNGGNDFTHIYRLSTGSLLDTVPSETLDRFESHGIRKEKREFKHIFERNEDEEENEFI